MKELRLQTAWQNLILMLFQDKVKINENEILLELTNLKNMNSEIKTYNLSEIEASYISEKEKEKIEKILKSIKEEGFKKTVSILASPHLPQTMDS